MSVISKEKYERLKLLPEAYRTNEQRDAIVDFERAEAQAPSLAEVRRAQRMHNQLTKQGSLVNTNPVAKQKLDEAMKIIKADQAYLTAVGNRADKAYVQPVKRIPDDLQSEFNFNWKSAYENANPGEKLRDTEADYDKLKKFIDDNMYDVTDPVELQKIAYKFHMYNPNTGSWSEFINSEQGKEFQNYLKDVEKYQRDKAIEDIFSGKDPTKVNYPIIGPTNVPGSDFLVDFGLPVSKQAAYNAVKRGEDPNLGPALAADALTNVLMSVQPGSKSVSPFISKGSNFIAPTVQNISQMAVNDEDPLAAGINTVVGGSVNLATPFFLNRYGSKFSRWTPGEKGYSRSSVVKEHIDDLANKAASIETKLKNGALRQSKEYPSVFVNDEKKIAFIRDRNIDAKRHYDELGYKIKDLEEMRNYNPGIINKSDYDFYQDNKSLLRGKFAKSNATEPLFNETQMNSMFKNLWAKEYKGKSTVDTYNKHQLEILLGKKISESRWNWLKRNMPDALKDYLTNAAGRSQMGKAYLNVPQMIMGVDLGKLAEEKKNKKPSISEIFGE